MKLSKLCAVLLDEIDRETLRYLNDTSRVIAYIPPDDLIIERVVLTSNSFDIKLLDLLRSDLEWGLGIDTSQSAVIVVALPSDYPIPFRYFSCNSLVVASILSFFYDFLQVIVPPAKLIKLAKLFILSMPSDLTVIEEWSESGRIVAHLPNVHSVVASFQMQPESERDALLFLLDLIQNMDLNQTSLHAVFNSTQLRDRYQNAVSFLKRLLLLNPSYEGEVHREYNFPQKRSPLEDLSTISLIVEVLIAYFLSSSSRFFPSLASQQHEIQLLRNAATCIMRSILISLRHFLEVEGITEPECDLIISLPPDKSDLKRLTSSSWYDESIIPFIIPYYYLTRELAFLFIQ